LATAAVMAGVMVWALTAKALAQSAPAASADVTKYVTKFLDMGFPPIAILRGAFICSFASFSAIEP
jgi:hypothetical protein